MNTVKKLLSLALGLCAIAASAQIDNVTVTQTLLSKAIKVRIQELKLLSQKPEGSAGPSTATFVMKGEYIWGCGMVEMAGRITFYESPNENTDVYDLDFVGVHGKHFGSKNPLLVGLACSASENGADFEFTFDVAMLMSSDKPKHFIYRFKNLRPNSPYQEMHITHDPNKGWSGQLK